MSDIINVNVDLGERSYKIHIGGRLLERASEFVPIDLKGRKVFILFDIAVDQHVRRLLSGLGAVTPEMFWVHGGEATKSFEQLQKVVDWLLSKQADRKSVLFVVGGGVVGDLGGFAASVVLRGIPFVQVPTTLLAQVDSSVGGKTGINAVQGKNLIGAFYQPIAVLCDTTTLKTLPERELKAGYAEIVKYGLLGSEKFFAWLEEEGEEILKLKSEPLKDAIETSCKMKAEIVGDDEREQPGGDRALLNLGHTFAHALEAAAGFDGRLLHGEAVSIGMVLAFRFCAKMGICPESDAKRMEQHLKSCGLKTEIAQISPPLTQSPADVVELMYHDKKAANGKIGFILAKGIGNTYQSSDVNMKDVERIIAQSKEAA